MAKPIKIKVTLEFNVDPDVWANEYGLDADEAAADARNFIPTLVREYVGEMSHVTSGVVDYVKKD
jgi:hypothetical protein